MVKLIINFLKSLGHWNYVWWIPLLITIHSFIAYLSKKNNDVGGNTKLMVWMYVLGGVFQLWVIVSIFSKNLIFDGMLYDNILFLAYALTFIALGCGSSFTITGWLGVMMVIVGSILLRVGCK